jgi:pathogenesis-related protein 1
MLPSAGNLYLTKEIPHKNQRNDMIQQSVLWIAFSVMSLTISAQTVPAETGSKVTQAQAQEALQHHNKARADVGTKPLEWSPELAAYAQEWADHLASNDCAFEHRSGQYRVKGYGENIFWGSASVYNALSASESWYSEIEQYVHGTLTSENWSAAGHYTQMVWYNTTAVGIGIATCKSGAVLIVANYNPPGNYMGEKAY